MWAQSLSYDYENSFCEKTKKGFDSGPMKKSFDCRIYEEKTIKADKA